MANRRAVRGLALERVLIMMVRLLYVSRPVMPLTTTVTRSILACARAHNSANSITGALCQGQGLFLQVLEGERSAVNRLYGRIMLDRRHQDVELLLLEEITARRFEQWSMAHVDISSLDPMVQLKHPEFDPYSASGAFAMTLLEESLVAGSLINLPAV